MENRRTLISIVFIFQVLTTGNCAFASDKSHAVKCIDLSGNWIIVSEYERSCIRFDGHTVIEIPFYQNNCMLTIGSGKLNTKAIVDGNKLVFPESVFPTVWDKGSVTFKPLKIPVAFGKYSGLREWSWVDKNNDTKCLGTESFRAVRANDKDLRLRNKKRWHLSTPEQEGFNIKSFKDALDWGEAYLDLSSILVIRNGNIVHEQYFRHFDETSLHNIYSVAKSYMSTAVGIAVDRQIFKNLETPLSDYFPEYFVGTQRPAITLRDLLVMSAGLQWNEQGIGKPGSTAAWAEADDQIIEFFRLPLDTAFKPGQWFTYSSANTHMLSVALSKAAKLPSIDFIKQYLFEPLDIRNFGFDTTSVGDYVGGYTLLLATRDMAKLGLLYLNKGQWFGEQIVSEAWVNAATRKQIENKWGGYGYHWWITNYAGVTGYSAMGYGGQQVLIVPDLSLVTVVTNTEKILENNTHYLLEQIVSAAQ